MTVDERIPDSPVFEAVYAPPRCSTLPGVGTVGFLAYPPDALGFFAFAEHDDAAAGVHVLVAGELERVLTEGGTTHDARDAVLGAALFDVEKRVNLPDLYATIREAWGLASQ